MPDIFRWLFYVSAGIALGAILPLLVLSCSDEAESTGPPGTQTAVVEETPPASPPVVGRPDTAGEPPGTTIASGGSVAEMAIGTYCWGNLCVDKIGPITRDVLEVKSGENASMAIPAGAGALREVSVIVFPAGQSSQLDDGSTAWRPDFEGGTTLRAEQVGGKIEFVVELAPGTYVLTAGMFFEQGDVQYGVVVEVG